MWKGSGRFRLNTDALRLGHPWLANAAQRGFDASAPVGLICTAPWMAAIIELGKLSKPPPKSLKNHQLGTPGPRVVPSARAASTM